MAFRFFCAGLWGRRQHFSSAEGLWHRQWGRRQHFPHWVRRLNTRLQHFPVCGRIVAQAMGQTATLSSLGQATQRQAAAFSCLRQAVQRQAATFFSLWQDCGTGNGADGNTFLSGSGDSTPGCSIFQSVAGLWGVLMELAGKFLQSPATGSHTRQHSGEGQCGKSDNFVQSATSTRSTKHCKRPSCGR